MRRILYFLLMTVFWNCQSPKEKQDVKLDVSNPLLGEWRNLTLRVEIDKKQGDPSSIFEIDESTWESTLKIRPIRTYFKPDGQFNSEHFNLLDSLVLNPEGTWSATKDEITMITIKPFNDTTSCTYTVNDDVVTFGCWVDWDEDGEKDDWYVGTQKKY
jgi:hypothetical protein